MGIISFFGKLLGISGNRPKQRIFLSKTAAAAGLPIIYGTRRVEAINVLKRVSKDNGGVTNTGVADHYVYRGDGRRDSVRTSNRWLHRIDVWGQGEITRVRKFWIDGDPDTHKRFSEDRPHFRALTMYGTDSQSALTELGNATEGDWTGVHRGLGVAYSWSRFFASTKFPQFNAEPELEALVEGLRVYDPREDMDYGAVAPGNTQDFELPDTWGFSNNRALVVLNYLMSDYGLAAPEHELDMPSFITAATLCDQDMAIPPVPTNNTGTTLTYRNPETGEDYVIIVGGTYPWHRQDQQGTTQPKYVADAVLDPKQGVVRNLQDLLEEFGWSLSWSNGKHKLVIEDVVTAPVMTLDSDTILGGWTIEHGNRSERLNRLTVDFANANKNYEEETVSWPPIQGTQHAAYFAEDGGRDLHESQSLATVTDFYRAKAIAEFRVRKSRVGERISGLRVAPQAMLLEPGDVVAIDFPDKGYTPPDEWFIVEKVSISSALDVSIDLRRYDATVYGADTSVPEDLLIPNNNPSPWDALSAIANLVGTEFHSVKNDGSVLSGILLSWDAPTSNIPIDRIEVQWRNTLDMGLGNSDDPDIPNYAGILTLPPEATACRISNLTDDLTYEVRVTYVTRLQQQALDATVNVDLAAAPDARLGRSLVFQGAYSSGTVYRYGDVVTGPDGTSYVFVSDIPASGAALTDTTRWEPMADSARLLSLASTAQAFTYGSTGAAAPASQSITFTATLLNSAATVVWTAKGYTAADIEIGDIFLSGTGSDRSMTIADFGSAAYTIVSVTAGSLADQITVVRLQDGADGAAGAPGDDALVGFLTNEAHTLAADASGQVTDFSGASGSFKLFRGVTDVSNDPGVSYSKVGNSTGLTGSINNSTGAYAVTGMTPDEGTLSLRATFEGSSIDKTFTVSKSRAGFDGAAGPQGDPGTAGDDAQGLVLTANALSFTYDGTGSAVPATQSIDITANLQNIEGSISWSRQRLDANDNPLSGGPWSATGNVGTVDLVTMGGAASLVISATVGTFTDSVRIVRVTDGADGADGYTISASPPALTIQTSANGIPKSGELPATSQIQLLQGTVDRTAAASYSSTVTGCSASVSASGLVTINSVSADSGHVDVTASHGGANVDVRVTFVKAPQGEAATSVQVDATVADTSTYQSVAGPVAMSMGSGGTIQALAILTYTPTPDDRWQTIKVQYRSNGSAWIDFGPEVQGSGAVLGADGVALLNQSMAGPTDAPTWEFRLLAKAPVGGSFIVQQENSNLRMQWV